MAKSAIMSAVVLALSLLVGCDYGTSAEEQQELGLEPETKIYQPCGDSGLDPTCADDETSCQTLLHDPGAACVAAAEGCECRPSVTKKRGGPQSPLSSGEVTPL